MARPRKVDEKPKDSTAITHISINDFLETRNTVVTGLSTLQSAISDLSRSYLAHTENLIGRGSGTLNFANALGGENGGFFSARGPTPALTTEAPPENKKRKRAPHDKNAPKRALTPFFLYLQTARPKIADEMGAGHTAKEVQDEGGKRWREMPEDEKEKWTEQYQINFARYKELMKAYKAGQTLPVISDGDAKRLYEQNKQAGTLPGTTQLETAHVAEEESDSSEDSSSDEELDEPAKAPSPVPAAKKQRVGKEATKKKSAAAAAAEPEPVLDPALRSPEKKKGGKKTSKAAEVAAEARKAAAEAAAPPKVDEKQKKKKRKSGVTDL